MLSCDIRHSVDCVSISHLNVIRVKALSDHNLFSFLIGRDAVSDSGFGCTLAKLSDVGTRKVSGQLGTEIEGHIWVDWGLFATCLEDVDAGTLVGKGDVNQLVETSGSNKSFIKNIGSVCSSNEEQILFYTGTVHFGEELIEHTVTSATAAGVSASLHTDGVEFVEEKHAGGSSSCFVEDSSHIFF